MLRIDIEKLKRLAKSHDSRRTKRKYINRGYIHQTSFYGVLHHLSADHYAYCRIEILSDVPIEKRIMARLRSFFLKFKPISTYTIWIYQGDKLAVKCVGVYK